MRLLLILTALLTLSSARAEPSAREIQATVRYSYSLQHADLKGMLQRGSTRVPFDMTLRDDAIRFTFAGPEQTIELQQGGGESQLLESFEGKALQPVSNARHGESVRGTDVNYEDLAMRFLYWDDVELADIESIGGRKAWKLHIKAPAKVGPYSQVLIWVDQGSGGMRKMEGYDWTGHIVKRYEVTDVQKIGDSWTLEKMNVETYSPETGKLVGRTSLFLKPKG